LTLSAGVGGGGPAGVWGIEVFAPGCGIAGVLGCASASAGVCGILPLLYGV